MSEHKEPIPSMIYNAAVGGHVTNSQQIIDENLNREQSDVNQEVLFGEPYNSTTPNGMGRVILKKTDNFKQVVEAQTDGNTIFVIKYDFTLTGDVNVPANCILEFNGGTISGDGTGKDTITGNNTGINASLVKIFNTDVKLAGSWVWKEVPIIWFGVKANDDDVNCGPILKMLCELHATIVFQKGTYYMTPTCINANTFAILGGQEHDNIESSTAFCLHKNSVNPSYILKLGGKDDFGHVDDYQRYKASHFNIEGIYFHETTGAFVKASNYDPYMYGALVLDNAAAGTVNVNFQVNQVAMRITTSWEINFKHVSIYYGGVSASNFMIPKIYIGKPNSVGSGGNSVNACVFHNLQVEAINGPILQVDDNAVFEHNLIDNITYEANGGAGFANGKTAIETFAERNAYKEIENIIKNNYAFDVIPMFDLGTNAYSNLFINNLTLNSANQSLKKYDDNKYLLEAIVTLRYYQKYIINNIDSSAAGICQNIYMAPLPSSLGNYAHIGSLSISSFSQGFVDTDDRTYMTDLFFLYSSTASDMNGKVPHLNISNTIRINLTNDEPINFGKNYTGDDIFRIIKMLHEAPEYAGYARFVSLPLFGDKQYPYIMTGDWFGSTLYVPKKCILNIYAYCKNTNITSNVIQASLLKQFNAEWMSYAPLSITELSDYYYLIQIVINSSTTLPYIYCRLGGSSNYGLLIESISIEQIPSCSSTDRPQNPIVGQSIFDTTLGKPIYWNGSKWIKADGTDA